LIVFLSLRRQGIYFFLAFFTVHLTAIPALVQPIAKGSILMDAVTVSAHLTNPIQLPAAEGEKQIHPKL